MDMTRRTALLAAGAGLATACTSQGMAQPAARPAWSAKPPLPFAVQEIYPGMYGGRIHVAGGLLGEGGRVVGVSDKHVAYDPETGVSEEMPKLPLPLHHPQLVTTGRLYVLGGFATNPGAVNWIMQAKSHIYSAGNWYTAADAPAPHAETVATAIERRIHIVGGRTPKGSANLAYGDHIDTDHHFVLDTGSYHSWEKAAPALSKRNSATGGMLGGLWHVAGGRHVDDGPSDAHEVYDPKEDKWRTAAPMPKGSGAGGNAAGVIGDRLYVFGGEYFHDGGKVHAEVWSYDPKTDAWEAEAPMPTPRHGLGGITIENGIWLVGGAKKPSGSDTTGAVERFGL
jgi:hypothetical protein